MHKLYQILMDRPNVRSKFLEECLSTLIESVLHLYVNMGTCSLHIVQYSLSTDESTSKWGLKKHTKVTPYFT